MKRAFFGASLLVLAAASVLPAHALEENPRLFRGIRSQGMGGLITTTGNYSEALFGNPARHSAVDAWKLSILDLTAETNTTFLTTQSEFTQLRTASGAGTISSASKLIGKNEHAALQLLLGAYYDPNFIGDLGFAFGFYTRAHTNISINYTTDLDTQTMVDLGPNLGASYKLLDGNLFVGMNLRLLYRVSVDGTINSLSFLTGSKLTLQNFGNQGMGFDGDIGGYYHLPFELTWTRMSVGLSINNIFRSSYNTYPMALLSGLGNRPINNDRLINMGLRLDFPDHWIFAAPILAIEIQDIGDASKEMSIPKRTHIGGEAKLSRVFALRAGLNQGYPTFGVGVDLPVVKLDFATYGEELAGNSGRREDRRLMFRMAFELM